ncbi:uncharacterized protein DUF5000 [Mucilaginibacter oryzae]|uniref:Uncharacterized protein DUF5000 n=1 Tax=Mucilaginibacter oryzae TaxID=468058 RepID=A0A316HHN3_9SPHI|nr:DUF4998 domain-containing protein [Mucilaginibacter oryzae]PWK80036.1 uncharacterized protein DUF5000 [Mucilaginibacter oryzae]
MKTKNIIRIAALGLMGYLMYGCSKQDTEFESFLNGKEVKYPGTISKITPRPGNLRAGITFHPSSDPSVTRYVVYWNNKADSIVYTSDNHNPSDSLTVIVPNLNEYIYSFTMFSYDAKGNRSVPRDINNVKVYGPVYQSGLSNRNYNLANPYGISADGKVKLNFNLMDTAAHNVFTDIKYTNKAGQETIARINADSLSIVLPDYKADTKIQFRSAFIPVKTAIDTFYVSDYEDFATINAVAVCDKKLFKKVSLPYDAGALEGGTDLDKLWDGSNGPQGYPNIWHSDGHGPLPVVFTFDMGAVYKGLVAIEETGRNCCHNPDDFEVWGIADITNAATSLKANDAGWAAEATAKGWKLLKSIKRNDDGSAPLKVNFDPNPPPVRYIRIRIKHNSNGEGNYTNMSELTFWNNALL